MDTTLGNGYRDSQQGLANNPSQNDREGNDKEAVVFVFVNFHEESTGGVFIDSRNLDRRSNSNRDRQVEFVLVGSHNSGPMFL